jgi:hypothetical protein
MWLHVLFAFMLRVGPAGMQINQSPGKRGLPIEEQSSMANACGRVGSGI